MNILNFLTGKKLIEKVDSPISGEVRTFKVLGRPSLVVGGMEQSGAFIGGIWKKALRQAFGPSSGRGVQGKVAKVSECLILGLGGGTVAKLVSQFWPEAKMVGVEIDPIVIELGRKYFDLDKVPNLKIINKDATEFIFHYPSIINHYSLILVDVYLGDQIPKSCETEEFLKRIKKLLNPGGLVIFNRLFYKEKKKQAENFIKKLEKIFSQLSLVRTASNLLIFAQK